MRTQLAAHTPIFPTGYPPYVNISLNDDHVEITVRSPPKEDGSTGDVAMIALTVADFEKIAEQAVGKLFFATKGADLQALRKAS